ncbi:FIST signal transduction protein [Benzoatithermus flavus]|uniref:FIST N-terminal domain-containing protein n=1 Tax=Benzoatithermus flavus TaxID=3108223 RepID=A0ABU8XN59_9PROT
MIRVAYGKHASAREAVEQCRRTLGVTRPCVLLAFCGGKHDPAVMLSALRGAFGPDVPIVGGSAAGVIWREGFGYSGLELGLAAFSDPAVAPRIVAVRGPRQNERALGRELGARIAETASEGATVLMLYDSVASTAPLRLHPASAIVEGVQAGLGRRSVRLIGGGTLTDMNLSDSWIFDGAGVAKHAAAALVFPSAVVDETAILHGCRPVSTFMKITRIDGAEVYELDGEPALAVIERMLGISLGKGGGEDLSLIATLGEKQGDPYGPYDENSYVNRLILRTDRATGSITLFEPDFRRGTRVQIMSRDNALMLDSVRSGVAAINRAIAGQEMLLGLYIDCAGRASARSGAPIEEADLVREALDSAAPLLGFYSGVEIAPFAGYSRPLDWTGVLTVLRRR